MYIMHIHCILCIQSTYTLYIHNIQMYIIYAKYVLYNLHIYLLYVYISCVCNNIYIYINTYIYMEFYSIK